MDTNYGKREEEIVEAGIEEIQKVLCGNDVPAKERLLFYLDWYLDPYYKSDMSKIGNDISIVLQNVVIKTNEAEEEVISEAIHLLSSYVVGPFDIIENNISMISQKYQGDVLYLINLP